MNNEPVLEKLKELIRPVVNNLGYDLYHIEFVNEDDENYLRVYIDKETGITLQDCEKVSRPISDILDLEDPIEESYYLEVSSPGIYRTLFSEEHMNRYIGYEVSITLKTTMDSKKNIVGELKSFDENNIYVSKKDKLIQVPREEIFSINLEGSFKEVKSNE